jgi:TRAP transporter 4TM/12TM fusion protein
MEVPEVERNKLEHFPQYLKAILVVLSGAGIVLAILQSFNVAIGGQVMYVISYYYLLFALFASIAFLVLPARKTDKKPRWYDLAAFVLTFGIALYFYFHGWDIGQVGWVPASWFNFTLALIFCLLVLELGRRMGGYAYLAVCLIFGLYPLYSGYLTGVLFSPSLPFRLLISFQVFGTSGLLGMPANVIGLVFGFLIFAGVLVGSGAGQLFLDLATALLGRYRGGAAKVSVLSSGLFGSLSGSIISNVIGTGTFTIPAMKRTGYEPHFAAAVEACASTGGVIMPPVMGAIAFIMCVFLGIDYSVIIIAAALPAILYYFGLLMQVDAHAAKIGLKGIPADEKLPSIIKTLKKGWPFIFVLIFLTWGLIFMKWSVKAPFYASALLILLSYTSKESMVTPKKLLNILVSVTTLIAQMVAIILPIGFVVCGLIVTGTTASLTSVLVNLGGQHLFLILLISAVVLYVLGMAGLCTPAYVFMAVTMAPTVIQIGHLDKVAVHLFLVWFANLSAITPPVALAAFVAAGMAGANPMKTGLQAMRLGSTLYFIPFFFILEPSLIFRGPILQTVIVFFSCIAALIFISAGAEGYLLVAGRINWYERILAIAGGFLIAFPTYMTTLIGVSIILILVSAILIRKRIAKRKVSLMT